jgi:hypothetical protein
MVMAMAMAMVLAMAMAMAMVMVRAIIGGNPYVSPSGILWGMGFRWGLA